MPDAAYIYCALNHFCFILALSKNHDLVLGELDMAAGDRYASVRLSIRQVLIGRLTMLPRNRFTIVLIRHRTMRKSDCGLPISLQFDSNEFAGVFAGMFDENRFNAPIVQRV